jgi:hypothetical protein
MNARLAEITRRRAALVAQAAAQRSEVSRLSQRWQMPLALADLGIALVRTVRTHPLAIALGVVLLVRMRRRLSVWIERIWTAWQIYHSLREHRARDRA